MSVFKLKNPQIGIVFLRFNVYKLHVIPIILLLGLTVSCTNLSRSESDPVAVDSLRAADNGGRDKDLVTWESLSQSPKSVKFHCTNIAFSISGKLSDDVFELMTLQVVLSAAKHTQTINLSTNKLYWWKGEQESFVKMIDINLDGHDDLLLFNNAGATGNIWYDTWLFDTTNNTFAHSEAYSGISALAVTKDYQLIKSYSRQGYCAETVCYYKPNGLKAPIPVVEIFTEPDNTPERSICWKITAEMVNGKWKETHRDTLKTSLDLDEDRY
jgi:hypothetical protein